MADPGGIRRHQSAGVVLDPDTSSSTLTSYFAKRFRGDSFNIGIAEPCMVDVGLG